MSSTEGRRESCLCWYIFNRCFNIFTRCHAWV